MSKNYFVEEMKHYLLKMMASTEHIYWPILLFFAPVKGILVTVGAFIALDTAVGIWRSRVTGQPITSKRMSGIVSKMLLYEVTVLCTYMLDVYILGPILESVFGIEGLITKIVALLLIYIESKSMNESYKEAKGIDLWAEFKNMLRRGKEVVGEIKDISDGTKAIAGDKTKKDKKEPVDVDDVFED